MKCYAKINLCLDLVGKRADGYHELDTIMHSIKLHDSIHVKTSTITTVTSNVQIEQNIIEKAITAYNIMCGTNHKLQVTLDKQIPMGAGMGGGSTDAAAIIKFLHQKDNILNNNQITQLCKNVGADVAFCYNGGCCRARGIGELLTPLPIMPPCTILVLKPEFSINTGDLFRSIELTSYPHANVDVMEKALKNKNLYEIADCTVNSLQYFCAKKHPIINELCNSLKANGALCAAMTGSGSAVFAIFEDPEKAEYASRIIPLGVSIISYPH